MSQRRSYENDNGDRIEALFAQITESRQRQEQLDPELQKYAQEMDALTAEQLYRTPLYVESGATLLNTLLSENRNPQEQDIRNFLKGELLKTQAAIQADPQTYERYGLDYFVHPLPESQIRQQIQNNIESNPAYAEQYKLFLGHILTGRPYLEVAEAMSELSNEKREYANNNRKEKYQFTHTDFHWKEENGQLQATVEFQPVQAVKPRRITLRLPVEAAQLSQERREAILAAIINNNDDSTNPQLYYNSERKVIVGSYRGPTADYEVYHITPEELIQSGIEKKLVDEYTALAGEANENGKWLDDAEKKKIYSFRKMLLEKLRINSRCAENAFASQWQSFLTPTEQKKIAAYEQKQGQSSFPVAHHEELTNDKADTPQPTLHPTEIPTNSAEEIIAESIRQRKEQAVYKQLEQSLQNQDLLDGDIIERLANEVVSSEQICRYILEQLDQKGLPALSKQKLQELDIWDLQNNELSLLLHCTEMAQASKYNKLPIVDHTDYRTEYDEQTALLFLHTKKKYKDSNGQFHETNYTLPLPVGLSIHNMSERNIQNLHQLFMQGLGPRSSVGQSRISVSNSRKYTFNFSPNGKEETYFSVDIKHALSQNKPANPYDLNSSWLALQVLAPAFQEVEVMRMENKNPSPELQQRANLFTEYLRQQSEQGKVNYEQRATNRLFIRLLQEVVEEKI